MKSPIRCSLIVVVAGVTVAAPWSARSADPNVTVSVGGQYRVVGNQSNFGFHQRFIDPEPRTRHFFNVRFRTWLDVVTNENVAGHFQIEAGHILWGTNNGLPKTYGGSDRTGLEIRKAFITHRSGIGVFRIGIQDWSDSFGHILADGDWDFNIGGIAFSTELAGLHETGFRLGAFRVVERSPASEADNTELLTLDLDLPIGKTCSVGGSLYYLRDDGGYSYDDTLFAHAREIWVGGRTTAKVGSSDIDGFLILNSGRREDPDWKHLGFAARARGTMPLGETTIGVQAAFSTGDDGSSQTDSDAFFTIAQALRDGAGAASYWSYLAIASPHGPSDVNDLGVSLQNHSLGLMTLQALLVHPVRETITGSLAVGWLRSTEENPANGETRMGTEIVGEIAWDLSGGLVLDLGGAILLPGDFFKDPAASGNPHTVEEIFTRLQLEF